MKFFTSPFFFMLMVFSSVNGQDHSTPLHEADVFVSFDDFNVRGKAVFFRQEKSKLYFLTAKELLRDPYTDQLSKNVKLSIGIFQNPDQIPAEIILVPDDEWAILKVTKDFQLNFTHAIEFKKADPNSPLYLFPNSGHVIESTPQVIKADFQNVDESNLGGGLYSNGKIIGLITHIETFQITALPIENLVRTAFDQLNIFPSKPEYATYYEFVYEEAIKIPILMVGGFLQLAVPISPNNSDLDEFSIWPQASGELFLEVPLFRSLALRGTFGKWRFKSLKTTVDGESRQFRNGVNNFSVNLVYFQNFNLRKDLRSGAYALIGYTQFRSMPEIRINEGDWVSFSQTGYLAEDPSPSGGLRLAAGGVRSINQFINVFGEMSFVLTNSSNILFNPRSPQNPTAQKEHIVLLNGGISISLGQRKFD